MGVNVFISHGKGAEPAAAVLAERLRAGGHRVLPDVRAMKPGSRWKEDVSQALTEAEAVVVLVGDDVSHDDRSEWSLALQASWADPGLRIVPVALGNAELPAWLREIQAVRVDSEATAGAAWKDAVLDAVDHPTRRLTYQPGEWHERLDAVVRSAEEFEAAGG